jgi:hypothetical protein
VIGERFIAESFSERAIKVIFQKGSAEHYRERIGTCGNDLDDGVVMRVIEYGPRHAMILRMKKSDDDQFSPEEAQRRMEAALRGAKIAGHKPMSEIAPQRNLGKVATKPTKAKRKPGK